MTLSLGRQGVTGDGRLGAAEGEPGSGRPALGAVAVEHSQAGTPLKRLRSPRGLRKPTRPGAGVGGEVTSVRTQNKGADPREPSGKLVWPSEN